MTGVLHDEWAVNYTGHQWPRRGWTPCKSREEAERRAAERVGANVMHRQVTEWVDVTDDETRRKAAKRDREDHL